MAGAHALSSRSRPGAARPELAPDEHDAWRHLIRRRSGLEFGPTRASYLARRLWQRLEALGLGSYADYRERVHGDAEEWGQLLELLVNGETSFFRHPPSFAALRQVLQGVLEPKAGSPPPRLDLWSAGCSTGQELYSLAMCALDACTAHRVSTPVRVVGGDLSPRARQQARAGLYNARQVESVPPAERRRHFRREPSPRGPRFRVSEALQRAVSLVPWNLSQPDTYPKATHEVIFCQNLLIYLRQEDRGEVVRRLGACLRPGGHLFLAPGEVLGLRVPGLEPVRFPDCLAFRRTA